MYLIDTNVISEARKGNRADPGVRRFLQKAIAEDASVFLSVVTIGELRRGIGLIRHRGDAAQAEQLEGWLAQILEEYGDHVLDLDQEVAQVWGRLRVPNHEHALDKQIAATALIHGLIVVTRNEKDFQSSGAQLLNPFEGRR